MLFGKGDGHEPFPVFIVSASFGAGALVCCLFCLLGYILTCTAPGCCVDGGIAIITARPSEFIQDLDFEAEMMPPTSMSGALVTGAKVSYDPEEEEDDGNNGGSMWLAETLDLLPSPRAPRFKVREFTTTSLPQWQPADVEMDDDDFEEYLQQIETRVADPPPSPRAPRFQARRAVPTLMLPVNNGENDDGGGGAISARLPEMPDSLPSPRAPRSQASKERPPSARGRSNVAKLDWV